MTDYNPGPVDLPEELWSDVDASFLQAQRVTESRLSKSESALNFAFFSFLGFTIVQFVFAVLARSDAMLADCAAMTVDVITYLLNYCAERMKHKLEYDTERVKTGKEEDNNPPRDGNYVNSDAEDKRELERLLLELIPPFVSATTLLVVTVCTIKQSIQITVSDPNTKQIPPDITVVLVFSALNLVLDGFNVLKFSRVDHVVLSVTNVHHEHSRHYHRPLYHQDDHKTPQQDKNSATENTKLLQLGTTKGLNSDEVDDISHCSEETDLNLNMCSAWTHIAADTLRSIAVFSAASFSALFPHLLTPKDADSLGAILVSIVILVSLFPLMQGIYNTAWDIQRLLIKRKSRRDV